MQMYDFQPSLHFSCDLPIIAQAVASNKCFNSYFTINLFLLIFSFTETHIVQPLPHGSDSWYLTFPAAHQR